MKLFPVEEKHSVGREPNGVWSNAPSEAETWRLGRLEFAKKNREESFENSKVGENEARKPIGIVSSCVRAIVLFGGALPKKNESRNAAAVAANGEKLPRTRTMQTNSRNAFRLKTNQLPLLGGIRNVRIAELYRNQSSEASLRRNVDCSSMLITHISNHNKKKKANGYRTERSRVYRSKDQKDSIRLVFENLTVTKEKERE